MQASSNLPLSLLPLTLLCYLVSLALLAGGQQADLGSECAAYLQIELTCQPYLQGINTTPSDDCCISTNHTVTEDPKCLCFFIRLGHYGVDYFPDVEGIQETKLRQLPAACHLPNATAAITDCPHLLGLAPNSAAAAIFANSSSTMTGTPPTTAEAMPEASRGSRDGGAIFSSSTAGSLMGTAVAVFILYCLLLVGPVSVFPAA